MSTSHYPPYVHPDPLADLIDIVNDWRANPWGASGQDDLTVANLMDRVVAVFTAQQAEIDALTARLHGDPDSGGTDGGEIGRLQRDVEHLTDEVITEFRKVTDRLDRRTSDEQHTYTVATS